MSFLCILSLIVILSRDMRRFDLVTCFSDRFLVGSVISQGYHVVRDVFWQRARSEGSRRWSPIGSVEQ